MIAVSPILPPLPVIRLSGTRVIVQIRMKIKVPPIPTASQIIPDLLTVGMIQKTCAMPPMRNKIVEFVDWAEQHAGLAPGSAQDLLINVGYVLYKMETKGALHPLTGILKDGNAMLLASKKTINYL